TSLPKRDQHGPLASVCRLPVEIAPVSIEAISLTLSGCPSSHAPRPISAYASSPYTGADETPTIKRPRCMSAICVEKNGYSRTNDLVPAIGSTSHRYSASTELCPVSSP